MFSVYLNVSLGTVFLLSAWKNSTVFVTSGVGQAPVLNTPYSRMLQLLLQVNYT
jgi:hypothetical protein